MYGCERGRKRTRHTPNGVLKKNVRWAYTHILPQCNLKIGVGRVRDGSLRTFWAYFNTHSHTKKWTFKGNWEATWIYTRECMAKGTAFTRKYKPVTLLCKQEGDTSSRTNYIVRTVVCVVVSERYYLPTLAEILFLDTDGKKLRSTSSGMERELIFLDFTKRNPFKQL